MRRAIDAKCRECIHDPFARGTWREQVEGCSSSNCALHPFRPRSRARRNVSAHTSTEAPQPAQIALHDGICRLPGPTTGWSL